MAKAELLEPLDDDFGRRGAVRGATAISFRMREGMIEIPEMSGSVLQSHRRQSRGGAGARRLADAPT
jgi:hypothetical protein